MTYKNKHWNYMVILDAIKDGMPMDGGFIKEKTDLFSSEICTYTRDLDRMHAIEKISGGKVRRPRNKITKKGQKILRHLQALHELMRPTEES